MNTPFTSANAQGVQKSPGPLSESERHGADNPRVRVSGWIFEVG